MFTNHGTVRDAQVCQPAISHDDFFAVYGVAPGDMGLEKIVVRVCVGAVIGFQNKHIDIIH